MKGCERCRDTGFEIVSVDKDGAPFEVARTCACRRGAAESPTADFVLQSLRIPARYAHCTIESYEILEGTSLRQRDALAKVTRYFLDYESRQQSKHSNDKGLGLLLTGGNGTGKTHLAVAAMRKLAELYKVQGQFWDYHELLREIRNSYNPSTAFTEYEVLEPIIGMELLLLDDLGAWKMSDWMNDTLFYILNKRYLAQRPTIITTNYPDGEASREELEAASPTLRSEYLVDRIGHRLRSRLLESCAVIRLNGDDRRKLACQPNNQRLVSWEHLT